MLAVFDLTGMVHRAWRGNPAGAAELVLGWARRVLVERRPTHAAAAVDAPGRTWRHDLFPSYKGKAKLTPDERTSILEQVRVAGELLEDVLGVRSFGVVGYEADDVVATLVDLAQRADGEALVVARDKDFCQLVDFDVRVLDWVTGRVTDSAYVQAKFKVLPTQFADYLAIAGDSSDGVPGVYGCGPVAARGLLAQFGTLGAALDSAENERQHPYWLEYGRVWARLAGSRAVAELARQLVGLRRDVPLGVDSIDGLRLPPASDPQAAEARAAELDDPGWSGGREVEPDGEEPEDWP